MEAKLMKIMEVIPLFFLLQKKCLKKCLKPTVPGELADEENDPHHHSHPSLPPAVVSLAFLIIIKCFYSFAPINR